MDKHLLYGRDDEENIVAVEPLFGKPVVEVFTRNGRTLSSRYERFKYKMYLTRGDALGVKDVYGDVITITPALGKNYYDYILETENSTVFYEIKKNAKEVVVPYIDSQYLVQTGKTLFNGMGFNDPLTLFFDIEVMTTKGYEFPNSSRRGDEVFIIAMRTNDDREYVLYTGDEVDIERDNVTYMCLKDETKLIEQFIKMVRLINPDVVANHNIFNFDLKYLEDRCDLLDVEFALGRNGSTPTSFETSIKFADRSREYYNYSIYGRHVIDTMFLVQYADVVLRSLPSYGLKDVVKFLGRASEDRTYIDGSDIAMIWREEHVFYDRKDLLNYAIDDVREAEIVYNEFGQSYFTLTQMVPMGYQEVFRYGTGNQVEYVFMREYMHQQWSYPKPDKHRRIRGGYADVLEYGLIKGSIIYADVKSLYPSLGRLLKIDPKKDELKLYQQILELLINTRYAIKAKIAEYKRQGNEEMVKRQKATDGSVKIMLNTMSYGFLASAYSGFNDYDEAERITTNGQKIMKTMNKIIEDDGGLPIKVDTDGVAMLMPDEWVGREEAYTERLTKELPEGIVIECDGQYDGIISIDKKSYALLEKDGTITIKGNTLIGRSIENIFTDFTRNCIEEMFLGDEKNLSKLYDKYQDRIIKKRLKATDISKRSSLNMTLEEYQHRIVDGNTNPIGQYELAIKADKKYTKGDVIHYYVKEFPYELLPYRNKTKLKKKKLKIYEAVELIENYDADYEVEYYTDRFDKITKKFMCLGKDRFEELFDHKIHVKAADKRRYETLTNKKWDKDEV